MPRSVKHISSAANPAIKALKSLALKKHRDESGLFIVEGLRHIAEALAAGWRAQTLCFSPDARTAAEALSTDADTEMLEMPEELLRRITGRDNTQDVIAAFDMRIYSMDEMTGGADALWTALEDIRDPGNLGTIIRTSDAVGAAGVVLIGQTCDPFAPETIRATVGAFARQKIIRATRAEAAAALKNWRGRAVGTHLRTDTDYRAGDYRLPLLLVMGSEQNGLSDDITAACTQLVKIPMPGGTESLNLAVSTGIMLYEICRSRL
ncbi:MAG: RNA methyltransferase [Alphaproteobacteria bacterium]|nr:RNA methyltransferase [Alphaproteobacteria bacterium]